MKVLALFMTILMLVTGFDLCNDEEVRDSKENVKLSKSDTEKHQEEAPCTPFCNCVRCPFSIVLPSVLAAIHISGYEVKRIDSHIPGNPSNIIPPVWQPPKYA